MRTRRRSVPTLLLVAVLALTAVAGPAMAAGDRTALTTGSSVTDAQSTADGDAIRLTQEFRLTPSQPGSVAVRLRYEIPDPVRSLSTEIPAGATVTETDGFERGNRNRYDWDRATETPTVTYSVPANRTIDAGGPEGAGGDLLFADVGEWALFTRPSTPTNWTAVGDVDFDRRLQTAGSGATGDWMVFLGEHEVVQRWANGQRFRLVVPRSANVTASPDAVLDSMTAASTSLRVDDRDDDVFVVAAPTDEVTWGVRGLQTGTSDMWVRDFEPVDDPENTWVHEYVHSRQRFETSGETRWVTEGTAAYYAALLTLEQNRTDFEAFRDRLADGERSAYDDVVLSNRSTWNRYPDYYKGALVAGDLDRRIRSATGGNQTLATVFREMNQGSEKIDQARFVEILADVGGESVADAGRRYTETSAPVAMWNRSQHERVFGGLPDRISYGLPENASGYEISGRYRNGTAPSDDPIRLATGERLTVSAVVENDGDATGRYNASLTVNGSVVDRGNGTVSAGERTTVPLSHAFDSPGRYRVGVAGDTVTVLVEPPAETAVTDLTVDRATVTEGDSVNATATVRNDAPIPAAGTVLFTLDGEPVASRAVALAPNSTTTVRQEIVLPTTGTATIEAGEADAETVTVEPAATPTETPTVTPTETPDATPTPTPTAATGAGFGVPAVLVATALVLACRRRRR